MNYKDIELRFVERPQSAPSLGANVSTIVRVLQCRKLIVQRWQEVWYVDGQLSPRGGFESVWTEWADVPLVSEGGL